MLKQLILSITLLVVPLCVASAQDDTSSLEWYKDARQHRTADDLRGMPSKGKFLKHLEQNDDYAFYNL